jgi:hypothetical protein
VEPVWPHSKWTQDDLDGKTVRFRIPAKSHDVEGVGVFVLAPNSEGVPSVHIETDIKGGDREARIQSRYCLPPEAVERISLHPDQTVAVFLLA